MINPEKSNSALDLAYLREMSGESADFMIEMLDTIIEQIPLYLADVQTAVNAKDWTQAGAFAHKVKPTFYYVGRDDLRDYMQWIERSCKDLVNLDKIPSALAEVESEMKKVIVQVAEARAKLAATL